MKKIHNHVTFFVFVLFKIRYEGTVFYLKAQDNKYSLTHPMFAAEKLWSSVFDEKLIVSLAPGNHFTISEAPFARVAGGILATAVSIKYKSLVPNIRRLGWSYRQRWAVQNYSSGVQKFLHSKHSECLGDASRQILLSFWVIFNQGDIIDIKG